MIPNQGIPQHQRQFPQYNEEMWQGGNISPPTSFPKPKSTQVKPKRRVRKAVKKAFFKSFKITKLEMFSIGAILVCFGIWYITPRISAKLPINKPKTETKKPIVYKGGIQN